MYTHTHTHWAFKRLGELGFPNKNLNQKVKNEEDHWLWSWFELLRCWRCLHWAADKQQGLGPLPTNKARSCCPAGGREAFRLPFSIMPCWVTLKRPKEIKQNKIGVPGGSNSEGDFWKCLWRLWSQMLPSCPLPPKKNRRQDPFMCHQL